MQHGVGQLEALFASSKANLKVLKQLEHELQFRQVPRALALLEQVQTAIPAAGTTPAPVTPVALPVKHPELWPQPTAVPPTAPLPSPRRPLAQSAAPVPLPATVVTHRPGPSMTFDDACKVLKVSPTSPWQEVEQTRRRLVQMSHPDRVAALAPERRDQARAEAKRVNAAYAVLSAIRAP
jgi:DnaJ-domain-containing protein 1